MAVDREALQLRLRGLFLDELAENVGVLQRGLLALEQEGPGAVAGDIVHDVFRAAHSLKGAAHSAGMSVLVDLCHRLEDALARLRDGSLAPAPSVIGPLLSAVDALESASLRLRAGEAADGDDVTQAARQLATLLGAPSGAPPARAAPAAAASTSAASPSPPTPRRPAGADARRDGSVRVPADRLEALLNHAGELLHASRGVEELAESLAAEARLAGQRAAVSHGDRDVAGGEQERAWRAMAERLEGLSRSAMHAHRVLTGAGRAVTNDVRHARMMPLTQAYEGVPRVARDLAAARRKQVRVELAGGEVEVDRPILDAVADAVLHLVRNAVDHGIEQPDVRSAAGKPAAGRITVEAALVQDGVSVSVTDDGAGIDAGALRAAAERRGVGVPDDDAALGELVFLPGLSTAAFITDVSGRGVGLDAVRARIEGVGGSVVLTSTAGAGCTVTLRLPLALSAVRVLLVRVGDEVVALPSSGVTRLLLIQPSELRPLGERHAVVRESGPVPVLWLSDILDLPTERSGTSDALNAVLVGRPPHEALIVADELLAEGEVVMKPLGNAPVSVPGVLGATVLPSGRVALVLNSATCVRKGLESRAARPMPPSDAERPARRARVLLAEDTITTRALERSILESAGYDVLVAVDGLHAWQLLEEHGADAVVSDVDMPRMSGLALCAATRRSDRFRDVPFILVTSLASDEDRRRGADVGANAYLVKSDFDQAILLDTLEQLL